MKNKVWGINVIGNQGVNVEDDIVFGSNDEGTEVEARFGHAVISEEQFKNLADGNFSNVVANPNGIVAANLTTIAIDGTNYALAAGGTEDYNELENKPIINTDLNANNFVPELNKIYRHVSNSGTPGSIIANDDHFNILYCNIDGTKAMDVAQFVKGLPYDKQMEGSTYTSLIDVLIYETEIYPALAALRTTNTREPNVKYEYYIVSGSSQMFACQEDNDGNIIHASWFTGISNGIAWPEEYGAIVNDVPGWNGIFFSKKPFYNGLYEYRLTPAIGSSANFDNTYSLDRLSTFDASTSNIAIGLCANSGGNQSSVANRIENIAIGYYAKIDTRAKSSIALGSEACIGVSNGANTVYNAIAIGTEASANADNCLAIGGWSQANNVGSLAIGSFAKSSGNSSIAIGIYTNAPSNRAIALGSNAYAGAIGAVQICEGLNVNANSLQFRNTVIVDSNGNIPVSGGFDPNTAQVQIGEEANASGDFATAVGSEAKAFGTDPIALGRRANASGDGSTALGSYTNVSGMSSIAVGYEANASDVCSIALGASAQASGESSIALGCGAQATATNAVQIGEGRNSTPNSIHFFDKRVVLCKLGVTHLGPLLGANATTSEIINKINQIAEVLEDLDVVSNVV